MCIENVRKKWQRDPDFMENIIVWKELPERPLRYGESVKINRRLAMTLQKQGIQRLFNHQSIAVNAAMQGENVVIATTTASGKSLCYTIPVFQRLLTQPNARALYIFPTKALTQDQQAATQLFSNEGELGIVAAVYDGDTPKEARATIRRQSHIVLTNPDMLHIGMLPHHAVWQEFWRNLAYVVVDELHIYRGVFGSHIANVIRRLQRICRHYGNHPQFICCSATIANPREHAERLFGQSFTLVGEGENGAPQQARSFLIYNPPLVADQSDFRKSILTEGIKISAELLRSSVKTVVFARSRHSVELVLDGLSTELTPIGGIRNSPKIPKVAGYRGGYLPHDRRIIEAGLRDGSIQGVVATNALELGIDIGGINAAILIGYPGSIASVWQQAGRAGRRDSAAIVVLIAGISPLEQYLCRHPHYLMGQSPEHALINPDSFPILYAHLQCAAYEIPIHENDLTLFSNDLHEMGRALEALVDNGILHYRAPYYSCIKKNSPAFDQSLRGTGIDNFTILAVGEAEQVAQLGVVDFASAAMLIHEEAIYFHHGISYFVEKLRWEEREAIVRPISTHYYTEATILDDIRVLTSYVEKESPALYHNYGVIIVTYNATSYRKILYGNRRTFEIGLIELPSWELDTTGYWLKIKKEIFEQLVAQLLELPTLYYGPNWEKQRQDALERDNQRCQNCSAESSNLHVYHRRSFERFHYIPGLNDHYLQANDLSNLETLCGACYLTKIRRSQMNAALNGLAYAFGQLAPLFLMCDPRDIHVKAGLSHKLIDMPYLIIYEATAGFGFSAQLFELHRELLRASQEMIGDCPCRSGCPSCIGPAEAENTNAKIVTKQLINILIEAERIETKLN